MKRRTQNYGYINGKKDVLIEVVAGALAIISKRLTIDEKEQNPDRTKLI